MAARRKIPPATEPLCSRVTRPYTGREITLRLSVVASLSSKGSISKAKSYCKTGSARPAELGDDALPVGPDELLLVEPDVVDVDLVEAKVHVVLDVLEVLVQVG